MPTYRFSWDNFDDQTVNALADAEGYPRQTQLDRRQWLSEKVPRPKDAFVQRTKSVLEQTWLQHYAGTGNIVDWLIRYGIGPNRLYGGKVPSTQKEYVEYISKTRNAKTVRSFLLKELLSFGDTGGTALSGVLVPPFVLLNPTVQLPDNRKPHEYQKQAWAKLSEHFIQPQAKGAFRGLLVMPTGSGKTFTAVRWLMENVVNTGGRILWIAHRHELLEQAALAFYHNAFLAPEIDRLRIRIVSGGHCKTTQINPADHILVCSVASLARRPDIAKRILDNPKLFLVIDEAHHAPAKSYRDLIEPLGLQGRERIPGSILGLTATPTRTADTEKPLLGQLFGGNKVHEVQLRTLIEQKFLARPWPVRVPTNEDVEIGVTQEDIEHLQRFHELSEEWLQRIGLIEGRNRKIIEHYCKNQKDYGKTLIFAVSIDHAALLVKALSDRGINAEYVASRRPDGTEADNKEIIEEFRKSDGKLDVLVNVQILTEGVDIPKIQTVFLTRPTASEILLRQMIGRGLRGPKMDGTEKVFIVSFEDHWEKFRGWESPLDLVFDILEEAVETPKQEGKKPPLPNNALPWELIQAAAEAIRRTHPDQPVEAFEAVPHGWYVLERTVEDDTVSQVMPVYEHQKNSWEALIKQLETVAPRQSAHTDEQKFFDQFFDECDVPRPSNSDIGQMIAHFRDGGKRPAYHDFEERKVCDPFEVASRIWNDVSMGEKAKAELIKKLYETPLVKAIYPLWQVYDAAIEDVLSDLRGTGKANRRPPAGPIIDPRPDQQLRHWPDRKSEHNLEKLLAQTLAQGAKILGVPKLDCEVTPEWSRKIIKGWYGQATIGDLPEDNRLKINVLLQSPDIAAETLKFLLWHEFLHLYLPKKEGHSPRFRKLERQWPGYMEADEVLDNLNQRFGIQYW